MEKALKIGKTSATGSFHLFIGKILSTVILAVGTIIVGWFIQEGEYGLYAIALIPALTLLLFQDCGVGSAMTKYCAHYRAIKKAGDLRRIIVAGLTFEAASGLILTVASLLMANFIASTIFGKPESAFLISVASIVILFTGLLMAFQSIFVGFERMDLNSLVMICQATVAGVLSPLLVYLGYGATGAIIGYTFSFVIASVVAMSMLYFAIFKELRPDGTNKPKIHNTLRPLLAYGIPLAIANVLAGILPQFYSFVMASYVDLASIGNYRIATNFAVLLAFFTFPIATVLFPAFSKLDPRNEPQVLKTVFTSSVKYTALLLLPATMIMIVLSKPIIGTIYGSKWFYASTFLALYVVSNLFSALGTTSMGSLLTAVGETKMLMKLNILTLLVGVPLAFFMIPQLGIIGVILVVIVAELPSKFIGLHWTWKHYGVKADFGSSARIFLASTVAATAVYLLLSVFNVADWVKLVIGGVLFLSAYLCGAPLIGAVNQKDIDNLRSMFSGLGIISKILEIPLKIIQKMLKVRSISNNKFSQPKKNL